MLSRRQFGFFRALYLSFYAKELYRDVAQRWKGIAALYLLMIIVLSGCLGNFIVSHTYHALPQESALIHVSQSSENSTSDVSITSDTAVNAHVINTSEKVTVSSGGLLASTLPSISVWLCVVLSVVGYGLGLLFLLIPAGIAKIFVGQLSFKALYRLEVMALTPGAIVSLFLLSLHQIIPLPLLTMISLLMNIMYFIYGIKANTSASIKK